MTRVKKKIIPKSEQDRNIEKMNSIRKRAQFLKNNFLRHNKNFINGVILHMDIIKQGLDDYKKKMKDIFKYDKIKN